MSKYRERLPQLDGGHFLTDSGLETTLIFQDGIALPHFASFDLLRTVDGRNRIEDYFRRHIDIARNANAGFVLESATWRASRDWGRKLGYSDAALRAANVEAVEMLLALQAEFDSRDTPFVVSGNIGPRGDGYNPDSFMTVEEARDYHAWQIAIFAENGADFVSAFTMTYVEEAIGIVLAARDACMPVVIAFTLETDGRLPSGQRLADAIAEVDRATGDHASYFMINCAHPEHFDDVIEPGSRWAKRILGLRANASRRSHAELDSATELDAGNPWELGAQYLGLAANLPNLRVFGGCCGTDHRHIAAIAMRCLESPALA